MPIRPTSLIRGNTPDNTSLVDSQSIKSGFTAAKSLNTIAETQLDGAVVSWVGENTSETSVIYGDGTEVSDGDRLYIFGDDQGNVGIYNETRDDFDVVDVTNSQIVGAGFGLARGAVVTAEDGNAYYIAGVTVEDSFSIGGTPRADVVGYGEAGAADGNVFYTGQPDGQSAEFYQLSFGGGSLSADWTFTAGGGFAGGHVVTDASGTRYVYTGDTSGNVYAIDTGGNQQWSATTTGQLQGRPSADSNNLYVPLTGGGEGVVALDLSAGTESWSTASSTAIAQYTRASTAVGSNNVFYFPNFSGELVAHDKAGGSEVWRSDAYDIADTLDPVTAEESYILTRAGGFVYITLPDSANNPGNIVPHRVGDGTVSGVVDTDGTPSISLGSKGNLVQVGYDSGVWSLSNTETEGGVGPLLVGSRPFVSIGSISGGEYTLEVYGFSEGDKDATDPGKDDPYLQETLTISGGNNVEQIPWWSFENVQVVIDDPDATAGDVNIEVSSSR